MGVIAATGWADVLIALIASVPGTLAALLAYMNRRSIRTPSGDPIGHVAERAEHASQVGMALSSESLRHATGDESAGERVRERVRNGDG